MKYQILLILVVSIVCIDICQQIITYEECIATKDEQCQWMSIFNQCLRSDNYLAGCDSTLSQSLCLKQLGDIFGNFAYCTFKQYCQTVNDLSIVKCSDPITKYGCLAITNGDALCKWERNSCQQTNQEDLSNLQQNFQDTLYSSSVCPLISGYLILHHTILWPLLEYEPNLITEADIQILEDTQSYEQEYKVYDQGDLQNNYVNSDGNYVWYIYKTTKTGTSLNLKITDRTRYGCIAMEILNDSEYLSLFSLQSSVIDGVNHVYCKYLNNHPTLVQLTAFVGNQCVFMKEEQLRYPIESLNCHSLAQNGCQLQGNLKCEVLLEKEYICEFVEEITENPSCLLQKGLATWQMCQSGGICFLNMSLTQLIGYCDGSCNGNYSACITLSQCKWIDSQIEGDNIHSCVPINGCFQLGVSQEYCVSMRLLCKWENGQCSDVENINTLSCKEANTIFTCTSVTLQNQYCIWINSVCMNVQDSALYSYPNNAYSEIQMNRLQCLNQKGYYCILLYKYLVSYDEVQRKCVRQSQITMQCLDKNTSTYKQDILKDSMKCNNSVAMNISKYFCLNFYNSNNRWDQFYNQCLNLSETNNYYECEQLQQVNARVCSFATTNDQLCLYDEEYNRCYIKNKMDHIYSCNDKGLNKIQCTSINTIRQTCKWSYGKCVNLNYADIQTYYCNAILAVNGNTCASFIGDNSCYYDTKFQNCAVAFVAANNCQQNQNPLACQNTTIDCFYNWETFRCEDATSEILSRINCNGSYLTKSACSKVSTVGAVCFWNNTCLEISELSSQSCSTFPSMNEQACAYINTLYINYLLEGNHCQYENGKCISNLSIISDCGSNLVINVHRCVAYTTGDCYFDNFKCKELIGPPRFLKSILNEMTCNGSNLGLCGKITTPGQICWVIARNNNIKCSNYSSAKVDTCNTINSDYNTSGILNIDRNDSHNSNICTIASKYIQYIIQADSCYFNPTTSKCEQPSDQQLYPCTTPGASKIFCLSQTYGSCIYFNKQCTYQSNNVSISCDLRNKQACTMGTSRCQWNTTSKLCVSSTISCPDTYISGVNQFNYLYCSVGYADCIPIRNGCDSFNQSQNLPCWLSINQGSCESQYHYCQWINGRCQSPLDLTSKCEQIIDKSLCLTFLGSGCVYSDGKCFQPLSPIDCDIYQFTNSLFCSQFPDCSYNSYAQTCTNQQLNIIKNSVQKPSQSFIDSVTCSDFDETFCNTQNILICEYSWGCSEPWTWGDPYCPYDSSYAPSKLNCEQYPDCHFILTNDLQSFCYEGPLICESIYVYNCLLDIDLPCYVNDNWECATSTFTDIESLAPYEVNRAACKLIEGGIYINNKCKSFLRKQELNCSDNQELTDCAFIELDCQINFKDDQFDSCIDGDSNFHELTDVDGSTNNWFGCVQLTTDIYIFDLNSYTCTLISDPYIIVSCLLLNKDACIQLTHQANLNCAWNIDRCIELITDDYQCSLRNQITCLKSQKYSCQWVSNSCQESLFTQCPTTELLLSPGVCQPYDDCYYEGQSCYLFTEYKLQFKHCDSLGLSQNDCIGQNIPCRWNDSHCENLNPLTASCNDLVSQSGCLSIIMGCIWAEGSCSSATLLDCSELDSSQVACLNQTQLPCSYDIQFKKCKNNTRINYMCLENISKLSCALVELDTCTFKQMKCQQQLFSQSSSCILIINEYGCMDTQMNCLWDGQCRDFALPQKISCQDLPRGLNNSACKSQGLEDICALEVKTKSCSLIGNSYDIPSFSTYSEVGYVQPLLTQDCSYFTEYFKCILSKKYSCEWKTACLPSSLLACPNQNFLGCVNSNDDCAWRDNACLQWPDYTIIDYKYTTLVSKSVCPKLALASQYDLIKFSCIPYDQQNDSCDTIGLSRDSCLSLQGQQAGCHFVVGQGCLFFTKTLENQCTDYLEVSVRVCQQIPQISCKYEPTKQMCISNSQTKDICLTPGLSQAGCEAVSLEPCYWDKNTQQCLQFKISRNTNQCDSQTIANPLACAQITYLNTKCTYDTRNHVCTTQFNKYSRCDTPGTNPQACYAIESEACIFKNGQCMSFLGGDYMCFQLTNVNPRACRLLITDNCAYNPLTYSCESVMENAPCNRSGLNINACITNSLCSWNNDDKQCLCSQLRYQDQCDLTQDACIASQVCQYYLGECVRRTCHHLTFCEGVVNGQSCYLNQNNQCQGATSCEDIVYLDSSLSCQNFNFKGLSCMQVNNQCASLTDFNTLCPVSDCTSTSCMKDMGVCRATRCSDRTTDNCTIKPGCGVIDKACAQISSCSQIADMEMCLKVTVNGSPCSWEEYRILDGTMHCTNQQCQLFGPSYSICNGNEINGQTCILDYDLQCRACEQITDMCTCNNSNNACTYQDQSCKSNSCSNYVAKDECESSNRCYWSRTDLVCRKMCPQNIRQDQCESVIYECHWNQYLRVCEQGVQEIPQLNVIVQMEEESSRRLQAIVVAMLILISI